MAVAGVLSVAMLGEGLSSALRSTGVALTAGIATALIGRTAPWIAQFSSGRPMRRRPRGVYVAVIGGLALVALWRWPETAFRKLD